jgi:alkylhydroperoxidase/carboxymuconolactone decarboxylase family protein YurZ
MSKGHQHRQAKKARDTAAARDPLLVELVKLLELITRNQTIELPFYLNYALESGVKPSEISEIMTHLAFYSGWPNASAADALLVVDDPVAVELGDIGRYAR